MTHLADHALRASTSARPRVMGIVNVTPDSFSDGGRHADARAALRALRAAAAPKAPTSSTSAASRPARAPHAGAARRGAGARAAGAARTRVTLGVPVSVDTSKPRGDARGARPGRRHRQRRRARCAAPGALDAVAAHPSCGVCLMHMQGEPGIDAGGAALRRRGGRGRRASCASACAALRARGIARRAHRARPGHRLRQDASSTTSSCWRASASCWRSGCPLLVGWSRKSHARARSPAGRSTSGWPPAWRRRWRRCSAARAIVRVHDVAATVDALKVWQAAGCCGRRSATSPSRRGHTR